MDALKTIATFMFGIGGTIVGISKIRREAKNPILVVLSILIMSLGVICYALFSQSAFLLVSIIGIILIFIFG